MVRFVDRDMFMRYVGGGVGHRSDPCAEAYEDDEQDDEMDIEQETSVHAAQDLNHNDQQDYDSDGERQDNDSNDTNDEEQQDNDSDDDEQQDNDSDDEEWTNGDELGPEDGGSDSDGDGDLDEYDAF